MKETALTPDPALKLPPWRLALARFFRKPWVELSIGSLIVVSVALTLYQF
jgi:hypothetical protein